MQGKLTTQNMSWPVGASKTISSWVLNFPLVLHTYLLCSLLGREKISSPRLLFHVPYYACPGRAIRLLNCPER